MKFVQAVCLLVFLNSIDCASRFRRESYGSSYSAPAPANSYESAPAPASAYESAPAPAYNPTTYGSTPAASAPAASSYGSESTYSMPEQKYVKSYDESYNIVEAEPMPAIQYNPCSYYNTQVYWPAQGLSNQYFIQCVWEVPQLFKCPGDLIWNQEITACDFAYQRTYPETKYDKRSYDSYNTESSSYGSSAPMASSYDSAPAASSYGSAPMASSYDSAPEYNSASGYKTLSYMNQYNKMNQEPNTYNKMEKKHEQPRVSKPIYKDNEPKRAYGQQYGTPAPAPAPAKREYGQQYGSQAPAPAPMAPKQEYGQQYGSQAPAPAQMAQKQEYGQQYGTPAPAPAPAKREYGQQYGSQAPAQAPKISKPEYGQHYEAITQAPIAPKQEYGQKYSAPAPAYMAPKKEYQQQYTAPKQQHQRSQYSAMPAY